MSFRGMLFQIVIKPIKGAIIKVKCFRGMLFQIVIKLLI